MLNDSNESDNKESYGEDVDYFIETISNLKETFNESEDSSENSENVNDMELMPVNKNKNSKNNYSKDQYIKSLEKKLKEQNAQISKLMSKKNKQMKPLNSLPNNNKKNINILNNDINYNNITNSSKQNLSFNPNHIGNNFKNLKKESTVKRHSKANSEIDIIKYLSTCDDDKYDQLYSKYLKLVNDYKNLSNNTVSTNEYSKLKTQYNNLKNKNNTLLRDIKNERNKKNENKESAKIKELKEQVDTFRKELVLSQAMVNSLRTELDQLNKYRINNGNDNDYDGADGDNVKYSGNRKNLNNNDMEDDISNLRKENEDLKSSLRNNNILLSKVLEENNRLRDGKFDNQILNKSNDNKDNEIKDLQNNINNKDNEIKDLQNIINNKDNEIKDLQNNINQYKEKFNYFNEYINNIKNQIQKLFNDLSSIVYRLDEPYSNKKYSDDFYNKLKEIKNEIQMIRAIDKYKLDSKDDEKCLQLYMDLVKSLLNELDNQQKINENINKNIDNLMRDKNQILNQNNSSDKTKNQLIDFIETLKMLFNDNGTKQLISDALNIINNLSNLYKLKNNNDSASNNNINQEIIDQENELEYIKKLLLNQRNNNNTNLTYEMHYNGQKVENGNVDKNEYYFQYD